MSSCGVSCAALVYAATASSTRPEKGGLDAPACSATCRGGRGGVSNLLEHNITMCLGREQRVVEGCAELRARAAVSSRERRGEERRGSRSSSGSGLQEGEGGLVTPRLKTVSPSVGGPSLTQRS